MYDAERSPPASGLDDLVLEPRVAGLEPVREPRPSGEIYESPMLGRMKSANAVFPSTQAGRRES